MPYPVLHLRPQRDTAIRLGHPWVFAGALQERAPNLAPGELVEVRAADGSFIGVGTAHPRCTIAVRLLSRCEGERIDVEFFASRLQRAFELRQRICSGHGTTDSFRLVNGEGDELPGFVVDAYGSVYVLQCLTAGAERLKPLMVEALERLFSPGCIYERSSGAVRREEGLPDQSGVIAGSLPPQPFRICENGLDFWVDVVQGQKTGFFLDQRDNRALARQLAGGCEVLNAFAYTGAFSVAVAAGGARAVVSVESSARACELARRNWELCGSAIPHEVVAEDVFTYLRDTERSFDFLVLDPPALVKRKPELSRGGRAYYDLHTWALRRARPGAYLMTFSCSQHVTLPWFAYTLQKAAARNHRQVQVLQYLGPGGDHPTLVAHPEGTYLKGILARIV
jgi:23S rRNA (cytosine1962-C5)-methyltransferase